MAPTLRTIAERLDVSTMTVSRAIRGESGVGSELKERILRTAREMGYSPEMNHAARCLKLRENSDSRKTLCALIDEEEDSGFYAEIRRGIISGCRALDYEMLTVGYSSAEIPLTVKRMQVDGVIKQLNEKEVRKSPGLSLPIPWVSLLHEVQGADCVLTDNTNGFYQLARYLYEKGHSRIAFIGPDYDLGYQRLDGLRRAASEVGKPLPESRIMLRSYIGGISSAEILIEDLLTRFGGRQKFLKQCSAIMFYNDFLALCSIMQLKKRGIRVPEDISVTGFDGVIPKHKQNDKTRVTSIEIPLKQIGAEAVNLLAMRFANTNPLPRKLMLPGKFIPGTTTRAIK